MDANQKQTITLVVSPDAAPSKAFAMKPVHENTDDLGWGTKPAIELNNLPSRHQAASPTESLVAEITSRPISELMLPSPTFNPRQARHSRARPTRSTISSGSATDHRPSGLKSCASAFYSHPPTSISLTQIESSRQVPTLKTFTIKVPKNVNVVIKPTTPSENSANNRSFLGSREAFDVEDQSTKAKKERLGLLMCGCGRYQMTRRQKMLFKVLLIVLGILSAIAIGVAISVAVTGSIAWNTKGRGF